MIDFLNGYLVFCGVMLCKFIRVLLVFGSFKFFKKFLSCGIKIRIKWFFFLILEIILKMFVNN